MSDSVEQAKQEVAELIAAQYPVQAIRDVLMDNFQKAPLAGSVEYWVDIKNSMLKQTAPAENPPANKGGFQYEPGDGGVIISTYTGSDTSLEIPAQIEGKPVVGIGDRAFKYCNELASVIIPDSVTHIGEDAFRGCVLNSVTLGGGLETIGNGAFIRNKLTGVTIPGKVTDIGNEAFADNQIAALTIGESVVAIGQEAFCGNQLGFVSLPASVKSVDRRAFNDNPLTLAVIPDGEVKIGDGAFGTFTQKALVKKASDYAFESSNANYTKPEDFKWEKTKDGKAVIIRRYEGHNKELTELNIPPQIHGLPVIEIGSYFAKKGGPWGLPKLASVIIPDSVITIGSSFQDCGEIARVIIGKGVKTIEGHAFCNNKLTEVVIPDGVTTIGNGAFSNNQLTSVTIPDSVISMSGAFNHNQLTSIILPPGLTEIRGFSDNKLKSLTIPPGVTTIGGFDGNELTSVSIPDSVKSIDSFAFLNNKLKSVTIPHSVTEIGQDAFSGCLLVSVSLGANLDLWTEIIDLVDEKGEHFPSDFSAFYRKNGKKAGTYTRPNIHSSDWSFA
jgi:GH24 family phage-related lysozyme (muramidase)